MTADFYVYAVEREDDRNPIDKVFAKRSDAERWLREQYRADYIIKSYYVNAAYYNGGPEHGDSQLEFDFVRTML